MTNEITPPLTITEPVFDSLCQDYARDPQQTHQRQLELLKNDNPGLMALAHAAANRGASGYIEDESEIHKHAAMGYDLLHRQRMANRDGRILNAVLAGEEPPVFPERVLPEYMWQQAQVKMVAEYPDIAMRILEKDALMTQVFYGRPYRPEDAADFVSSQSGLLCVYGVIQVLLAHPHLQRNRRGF